MRRVRPLLYGAAAVAALLVIPLVGAHASSPDVVSAGQSTNSLSFGSVEAGQVSGTQTVTVTSTGGDPLILQAATLGGDNPSSFWITSDSCSHKTLANGATCTVGIAADPQAASALAGTLTIASNTQAVSVSLSVTGHGGSIGTYHPVTPTRILDTRYATGGHLGVVGPGGIVHLKVDGVGGLPASGVSAVVLNVTVAGGTTSSFLTAYPDGAGRPNASNLNFTKNKNQANSVTVGVGSDGVVDLYNSTGSTNIIADVFGYFVGDDSVSAGGQFHAIDPLRLIDTRSALGEPIGDHSAIWTGHDFGASVNAHVKALVVNITAVNPTATGWLTAWNGADPGDGSGDLFKNMPKTSTLNFVAGVNTPNLAIVPTADCPQDVCGDDAGTAPHIAVESESPGTVAIIVDLLGYFDDGSLSNGMRFQPSTPTRIVDSRSSLGAPHPLGAGQIDKVSVPASVADDNTGALATNMTAVNPTIKTFMTFWPYTAGSTPPQGSTLNPIAHQTVANAAVVTLGTTEKSFDAYNNLGSLDFIVDVAGRYDVYPLTRS